MALMQLARIATGAAALLHPVAARGQDGFEIQVYDATTAARGEAGLELHANAHVIDHADNEGHLTFEPHYGLTGWAEIGCYLQTAISSAGELSYAGAKLRLKLRAPQRAWGDRVGLALNGELSAVPARFEPDVWGSEIRPILDFRAERIYASLNPILAVSLRGAEAGHPLFEPAAKLTIAFADGVAVGAEAYGAFGPLDALGSEREGRWYAVVDLAGSWWDLNLGAGYTWGTNDHVVAKMIVGIHPTE